MAAPAISIPGVYDPVTINGTNLTFQTSLGVAQTIVQSEQDTAAGRPVFTAAYVGDGYPDQTDRYAFDIPFDLTETSSGETDAMEFLRKLRKMGGTHTLCIWQKDAVYWTAAIGDTNFYLPRRNAPSIITVSGHGEADDPVTLRVSVDGGTNWTSKTVTMKDTVATTDAPGAGNVWIGRTDRQIKLGDTPAAETWIEVVYIPLYTVVVATAPSDLRSPVSESVSLRLVETVES